MRRAVLTLLALDRCAAAWLPACSAPTSSSPTLDVTLTSNPDPASASGPTGVQYKVTNADDTVSLYEYDYRTSFTVTIQENGRDGPRRHGPRPHGAAGDGRDRDHAVRRRPGVLQVQLLGAPPTRSTPTARRTVGFDVWYDLPNGGREALVTVGFTFQDDDDNTYSDTLQVKVAP